VDEGAPRRVRIADDQRERLRAVGSTPPGQFREPTGAAYTTLIGRLRGDLSALIEIGSRLQRTGARPIEIL